MFVQQFFVKGIAHSSYLLGGYNECAIVDPRRDVQVYLDAADQMGMRVTHVLETHLHADFVSGHLDLAEETGADIYAPREGQCKFDHTALAEGDTVQIEDLTLEVLETPGHTPEHLSYVVIDASRGAQPAAVFCGDTLFVGDVGRPDLFPGRAQELASKLYDSLHQKLLELPDYCEVYPAHGAGSLCGRSMGAKRTSTIGYERLYNTALGIDSRDAFIESLTTNMPAAPDHFARCSAINANGPELVKSLPQAEPLAPDVFRERSQADGALVLDIRTYEAFGGMHVPGAWHIGRAGNFATFAGWLLPPNRDIFIVADAPAHVSEAAVWLRRVGLDRVIGYLEGGMFAWARRGLPTAHVCQLSAPEVRGMAMGADAITILDVRAPSEYEAFHLDGAVNMPLPDVRTRYAELDPDTPTVVTCNSGQRSSAASSILKQHGFERLSNAAGGMSAYAAAGYGPECPLCVMPHGPRSAGRGPV